MNDLSFKRFKIRWFILYFIIVIFLSLFIPSGQYSGDISSLILGFSLVVYMLYQRSSHNIGFSEAPLQLEMPKKRWAIYILFSFFIKIIGVLTVVTLGVVVMYFFQDLLEEVLKIFNEQQMGQMTGWNLIFLFISICIFAPIWEELFFRGILLRRFAMKWKVTTSIVVSSLIFGFMHIGGSSMLHAFLFGCFLAYTYLKTKNILVPIILHSVSNFFSFVTLLFPGETNVGEISIPSSAELENSIMITAVLLAISLAVFIFIVIKNWSKVRALPKVEELPINEEADHALETEIHDDTVLTEMQNTIPEENDETANTTKN